MEFTSDNQRNDSVSAGLADKQFQLASRGLRFGAIWLEALFMVVTLFIGWIIWSLIVWGKGQTPAKQVLRMRVIDQHRSKPAEWGRMALRQAVIPWGFEIIFVILLAISGYVEASDQNFEQGFSLGFGIIIFAYFAWVLTDALWITRPEHQRLTDVLAGTIVVKESN